MSRPSGHELVALSTLQLTDGLGVLVALLLAYILTLAVVPPLIRKMRTGGMVGKDVNKASKPEVAELGGIAALFAFSVSLSLVVGIQKILGNVAEPPFLASISVFFMAAMIGLIDDISNIRQRLKAVAVAFAALPLMLVHLGPETIDLPLGLQISFPTGIHLLYWLILVPIGVTGFANAMNMSAGYNGLESGQIAVVSIALLCVTLLRNGPDYASLIFAAIAGSSLGLYFFNRFPARTFIGDIGTLGLGAALASGVILGHIEFYGLIAIAPAFYEAAATTYYGFYKENGKRKIACRNPVIHADGRLEPPAGASRYTLAYWLLSRRSMSEKTLVWVLLGFYAASGAVAILLSVV